MLPSSQTLCCRARLASPYTFDSDTEESTDVRLFAPDDIPWEEVRAGRTQQHVQQLS